MSKYKRIAIIVLCIVIATLMIALPCYADQSISESDNVMELTSEYNYIHIDTRDDLYRDGERVQYMFPYNNTMFEDDQTNTASSVITSITLDAYDSIIWKTNTTKHITTGLINYFQVKRELTIPNKLHYESIYLDGMGGTEIGRDYKFDIQLHTKDFEYMYYSDFDHIPTISSVTNDNLRILTTMTIRFGNFYINENDQQVFGYKTETVIHEETGQTVKMFKDIRNMFPTDFNGTKNIIMIALETDLYVENVEQSEDCKLLFNEYYRDSFANSTSYMQQYFPDGEITLDSPNIEISGGIITWLSDTLSGFLNTELFGNISIGSIVWFVVGIGVLFAILKIFAGG